MNSTNGIKGAYTALITPFHETGVDYESLEKLIEYQIENGIDGLVPVGTTGESPTLSHDEHKEVVRFTVEKAAGRCKVIAGAGSNSTSETLELTAYAEKSGADGVLLVCPYYNKPNGEGLYRHYESAAKSTEIDIVLYNIPGRSGVEIPLEVLVKLSKLSNVKAVKDATGNIDKVSAVLSETKEMTVLSGNDSMVLPLMAAGGSGVISVVSNFLPGKMKKLVDLMNENRLEEARVLHYEMWNLFKKMFITTNPMPVKAACYKLGLIACSDIRLPLTELSPENDKTVSEALEQAGLKVIN